MRSRWRQTLVAGVRLQLTVNADGLQVGDDVSKYGFDLS